MFAICRISLIITHMNSTLQVRKRRLQDTLIIAGDGVIAFSAWALVKSALFLMLADEGRMNQLFGSIDEELKVYVFVIVGIMVCIDLAVRVFVGMSARAEARGKKKGVFYLVVAVLAGLVNAYSAVVTTLGMAYTLSSFDTVVTVAVELTAFVAVATVVYCSVRLRSLDKATG